MKRDDRPIRVTFTVICESPLSMQEGGTVKEKAENYANMCYDVIGDSTRSWGDHNLFIDVEKIEIIGMDGETVEEVIEEN